MLWIKALHLIAVISWMAGLLYLPRLFVYHAECEDAPGQQRFAVMEKRLFFYIMTPAALLALLFGMALMGYGFSGKWLPVKLICVALLVAFHVSCGVYMRQLAAHRCRRSARFFRLFNEAPTLLMIIIVCLATVKPF